MSNTFDNDFGGPVEETIIMSVPQASGPASHAPNQGGAPKHLSTALGLDIINTRNKFLDSAATLLAVILNLEPTRPPKNVSDLYVQLNTELKQFVNHLVNMGADGKQIKIAGCLLCSAIDEIVLNTPWGHSSTWSQRTLLRSLYNTNNGGEFCFQILDNIKQTPASHIDLLELYYVIINLGFKGKYYQQPAKLNALLDELFNIIKIHRGEPERDLSSHWKGIKTEGIALSQHLPLWVIATGVSSVLLVLYVAFRFWLSSQLDPTYQALLSLTDLGPIERQGVQVVMIEDRVTEFTLEDINFQSGKADLPNNAKDILRDIVPVINKKYQPKVTVIGHTDSVGNADNNKSLSQRRAQSVREELVEQGIPGDNIQAYGLGEEQPIASNLTEQGRKKNRRVEIIIEEASRL